MSFAGDIARILTDRSTLREKEVYGDVSLSIQASHTHYCDPRQDGLPIEQYASVEVGLLGPDGLCLPSSVGIEGFDHLFEEGVRSPVAGYVSWEDVNRLRDALSARLNAAE